MNRFKNIEVEVVEAKQIELYVEGLREYKDALLIIVNNVRTDRRLYAIGNDAGNSVYITCREDVVEDVVEWLEGFGEIKGINDVLVYIAEEDYEYDFEKYSDRIIILQ